MQPTNLVDISCEAGINMFRQKCEAIINAFPPDQAIAVLQGFFAAYKEADLTETVAILGFILNWTPPQTK